MQTTPGSHGPHTHTDIPSPQLKGGRIISYLPLSHIAAQLLDIHLPMYLAGNKDNMTTYFARPDALKGSLGTTLKAVRPTIFFGVPRVWEKFAEKMKAIGAETKGGLHPVWHGVLTERN